MSQKVLHSDLTHVSLTVTLHARLRGFSMPQMELVDSLTHRIQLAETSVSTELREVILEYTGAEPL